MTIDFLTLIYSNNHINSNGDNDGFPSTKSIGPVTAATTVTGLHKQLPGKA